MSRPLPPLSKASLGPQVPRRGHWLLAGLGRLMLRLQGWHVVGKVPDVPRAVLTFAPHTSNHDGLVGIPAIQSLRIDVRFMGKHSLFQGRLGKIMRWLGGIPVDRNSARDVVEQTVAQMANEPFWLAIAPEGTRNAAESWKTGFYRIAERLQVPIVVFGFCYKRKQVRVVYTFTPSGDLQGDLSAMVEALADIEPCRPEKLSRPLRFRRLSDPVPVEEEERTSRRGP